MTAPTVLPRLSIVDTEIRDSIVGTSPIELGVDPDLRALLSRWAEGRTLVVDYFASRRCGVTVGDLTARFANGPLEPRYFELLPIGSVRVIAERALLALLADGASLRRAGPPFLHGLAISLVHPDHWMDFLDCHPGRPRIA